MPAQQQVLDNPPASAPLDSARTRECFKHAMPPLAADTLVREGAWLPLLDAWLDAFAVPDNLSVIAAVDQLRRADSGQRKAWAVALVSGQYDSLPPALVLLSRRRAATGLDPLAAPARPLRPARARRPDPLPLLRRAAHGRGDSPPRAAQRPALPVCSCALCEWHYVRLKCSHCRSTKKLDYLHFEGSPQGIKAEACPECNGYLKQLYLELAPDGESLSADSTLDLDLLLADQGYNRQAPNLLLAPGNEA